MIHDAKLPGIELCIFRGHTNIRTLTEASDTVPTLLLSLVYHNVVPSVCAQLEGDRKKITTAIVVGSFVPFLMRFGLHGRREIAPLARLATFFLFVQFHLLNGTI